MDIGGFPGGDVGVQVRIRVAVPGTCGELVQGTLDGVPCLVSCPIGRYSVAEVYCSAGAGWAVLPQTPKVQAALRLGLAYLGNGQSQGTIRVCSDLPQGRGYGSSTADVGAVLYALGRAVGRTLTAAEVGRLAIQVEPSDSSLFPGLTLWDHRHGDLTTHLGAPPVLTVIVLDPGGEVDTLAFNSLDHRAALRKLAPLHREAFTLLQEGLRGGDLEAVGAAATLSATAHQAILCHPLLESLLPLARELKALGVCRAHSGTLLGLLIDPVRTEVDQIMNVVARHFGQASTVFSLPLVSGGPRWLTSPEANITTLE